VLASTESVNVTDSFIAAIPLNRPETASETVIVSEVFAKYEAVELSDSPIVTVSETSAVNEPPPVVKSIERLGGFEVCHSDRHETDALEPHPAAALEPAITAIIFCVPVYVYPAVNRS
jgi:hypothetical protein